MEATIVFGIEFSDLRLLEGMGKKMEAKETLGVSFRYEVSGFNPKP